MFGGNCYLVFTPLAVLPPLMPVQVRSALYWLSGVAARRRRLWGLLPLPPLVVTAATHRQQRCRLLHVLLQRHPVAGYNLDSKF
jgi:hypothetical protein